MFAAHRSELRRPFYRIVSDIQSGVGGGPIQTSKTGVVHDLDKLFTLQSSTLTLVGFAVLVYAAVEGIEAVGLWLQKRWAEYLTFIVTTSFLPLEVYEMTHKVTPFKVVAFIINVAVVAYLLYAKRLFGLRGGVAAEHALIERDCGWEALERSSPWSSATEAAQPAGSGAR